MDWIAQSILNAFGSHFASTWGPLCSIGAALELDRALLELHWALLDPQWAPLELHRSPFQLH